MARKMSESQKRNIAFAFMGLVGIFLILILVMRVVPPSGEQAASGGGDSSEMASSGSSVSSSPTSGSSAGAVSVGPDGRAQCDVKVEPDKAFSAEVPGDIRWDTSSQGVKFPLSASVGPLYRPGYVGQCYAHSPSGAAMAAVNYVGASSETRTTEQQRRVLLSKQLKGEQEPVTPSDSGFDAQVGGYAVQQYSTESARVKVYLGVMHEGKRMLSSTEIPLVWEEGDWKILLKEQDFSVRLSEDRVPQNFLAVNKG